MAGGAVRHFDFDNTTFRCRACGEFRPAPLIQVRKRDAGAAYGWPPGRVTENYQYCGDRAPCAAAAAAWRGYAARIVEIPPK